MQVKTIIQHDYSGSKDNRQVIYYDTNLLTVAGNTPKEPDNKITKIPVKIEEGDHLPLLKKVIAWILQIVKDIKN